MKNEKFSLIKCSLNKRNINDVISECIMIGKKSKNILIKGLEKYLENHVNISNSKKKEIYKKQNEFLDKKILIKNNSNNYYQKIINKIYSALFSLINSERKRILSKIKSLFQMCR